LGDGVGWAGRIKVKVNSKANQGARRSMTTSRIVGVVLLWPPRPASASIFSFG